jgi:hypothetical protein
MVTNPNNVGEFDISIIVTTDKKSLKIKLTKK